MTDTTHDNDAYRDHLHSLRIRRVVGEYIAARQATRRAADLVQHEIRNHGATACLPYIDGVVKVLELDADCELQFGLERCGQDITELAALARTTEAETP